VQGSESDEAIHGSESGKMDCFAALAMTIGMLFQRRIGPIGEA
jgi:hypothetical protein